MSSSKRVNLDSLGTPEELFPQKKWSLRADGVGEAGLVYNFTSQGTGRFKEHAIKHLEVYGFSMMNSNESGDPDYSKEIVTRNIDDSPMILDSGRSTESKLSGDINLRSHAGHGLFHSHCRH